MNRANHFFTVQVRRGKFGLYVLKVPKGDNEWSFKQKKYTKGENPKKYLRL